MCGRYELNSPFSILAREFGIVRASVELTPNYNIAPSRDVAVVINDGSSRQVHLCKWGFIPSWAKDPSIGHKTINARAETVASRPAFRSAFRKHRCLIVANGFYEWTRFGNRKVPYYIHLKSGRPFGFAGLYSHWAPEKGEGICTCTIITIEANELVRQIHDRMPVIVSKDREDLWLDPEVQDTEALQAILRPYPSEEMEMYEVSTKVNSPGYNVPEALKPV